MLKGTSSPLQHSSTTSSLAIDLGQQVVQLGRDVLLSFVGTILLCRNFESVGLRLIRSIRLDLLGYVLADFLRRRSSTLGLVTFGRLVGTLETDLESCGITGESDEVFVLVLLGPILLGQNDVELGRIFVAALDVTIHALDAVLLGHVGGAAIAGRRHRTRNNGITSDCSSGLVNNRDRALPWFALHLEIFGLHVLVIDRGHCILSGSCFTSFSTPREKKI